MSAPRFYVVESGGLPIGRNGSWFIEYLILDRAYCHRVVVRHGTSAHLRSGSLTGKQSLAVARSHADRETAALNAEHDAWAAA